VGGGQVFQRLEGIPALSIHPFFGVPAERDFTPDVGKVAALRFAVGTIFALVVGASVAAGVLAPDAPILGHATGVVFFQEQVSQFAEFFFHIVSLKAEGGS